MTDIIYPPRNLPGDAETWGRAIEGVISDTRRTVTQVQQTLGNDGRSTSGQLAVISRQLDAITAQQLDLSGRTSFSAADLSSHSYNATGAHSIDAASVNFTVERGRRVRVTFSAQMMANTGPSGTNVAVGHLTFALDGVQLNNSEVSRGFVSASTVTVPYLNASVSANALLTLPQGSYTVTPVVSATISGTAAVTATNSFLFVDILEPA